MESMFVIIPVFLILAGMFTGLLGYVLSSMVYAESKPIRIIGKTLGIVYSGFLFHSLTMVLWAGFESLFHRLSELDFGLSYVLTLAIPTLGYIILAIGWLAPAVLGFYFGGLRKKKKIIKEGTLSKRAMI